MNIAIVGSRDYPDLDSVRAYVNSLPLGTVVVSGGGGKVDLTAEQAAKARGLETLIFRAEWKVWGLRAGPIRNSKIVEAAHEVVAFWDGRSRGTHDTVQKAFNAKRKVTVYTPENPPPIAPEGK